MLHDEISWDFRVQHVCFVSGMPRSSRSTSTAVAASVYVSWPLALLNSNCCPPPTVQVFNELNARSIGNDLWVFYSLHKNAIFAAVIVVTIGCQIFIVEVGGKFTSTTGLTLYHWGWSVLFGACSTPLGVLMRFIPVKENPASFANFYDFDSRQEQKV